MRKLILLWMCPVLLIMSAVQCYAQVNAQQKLLEARSELERYVADENEYLAQTRRHYDSAVDHLMETALGYGVDLVYGKTAKKAFDDLKDLTQAWDASRQGDSDEVARVAAKHALEEQLDNTLSEAIDKLARGSPLRALGGALGQAPALIDTVFDMLYLHWDAIQRQNLDGQREAATRAVDYWQRRVRGETGSPPPRQSQSIGPRQQTAEAKLRGLGIEATTPDRAIHDGLARIVARAQDGYALADLQIVNLSDRALAVDFGGSYLIPASGGSGSQRLGLVSVVNPRTGARWSAPRIGTSVPVVLAAWFQAPVPSPAAWYKNQWVLVAPHGSVAVSFNSVCLDHSRGVPARGEGYNVSGRPLPPRLQRLLVEAALNRRVPQSEVWNTIAREDISWYDPRNGFHLLHVHGYGAFGEARPGQLQVLAGEIEWRESGGADDFTVPCSEVREIARNALLQSGQSFHVRLQNRNLNFIPVAGEQIDRVMGALQRGCEAY